MTALGLPLALALGALAELAAGLARYGPGRRSIQAFPSLWAALRRAWARGEAASPLEVVGAAVAMFGAGLVGAAAVGAGPGSLPLVYLALVAAAAGGYLVAAETPTRPAGGRIRGRLLEAALAEPVAAAALAAAFLRWRAESLERVWGAQAVLGTSFEVGPALASAGTALAIAALLAAAALRAMPDPEPPRGAFGRPGGGAALLRIARWALVGATASLVPALLAGLDLTGATLGPDVLVWAGVAAGAAVVLGAMWGAAERLPRWARRGLVLPAAAGAAAAALLLVLELV